jgi:transposase
VKSRLDPFKTEIVPLLRNGSPKSFVVKRYKVSEPTLYNWLSKHGLEQEVQPRVERPTI